MGRHDREMLAALMMLVQPALPARTEETIAFEGRARTYLLQLPANHDPRKATPVVMGFHGWTSNAKQFELYTGLPKSAAERGCIAITPQGLGRTPGWNMGWLNLTGVTPPPDDAGFAIAILDSLKRRYKIDEKRVFVAGHSNGAMLSHLIAARYPDRIAAFGAVAGTVGLPGGATIPAPKGRAKVSGLIVHGDKDPTVAFTSGAQALLRSIGARDSALWWAQKEDYKADGADRWVGRGGEIRLLVNKGGGHEWPQGRNGVTATREVLDFFTAHPKR